jgi:hypothetical protein
MRVIPAALVATTILIASGCGGGSGGSIRDVEASQIEAALIDSTPLPGARPDQIDAACKKTAGTEGRWECTLDGQDPVTEKQETDSRMSFPDDRGVHLEVTAWVTHSDQFDSIAFAAVQTGGDSLYEGGGAYFNGGCCIEEE